METRKKCLPYNVFTPINPILNKPPSLSTAFIRAGLRRKKFASALWLKDITPSAALRRWYHENPEQNFDGFVTRYHEELQGEVQQRAVARLLQLEKQNGRVWLLTAVKNPQRSHVSALAQFLGAVFEYRE